MLNYVLIVAGPTSNACKCLHWSTAVNSRCMEVKDKVTSAHALHALSNYVCGLMYNETLLFFTSIFIVKYIKEQVLI